MPLQRKILDCCVTLLSIKKNEDQSLDPKALNEFEYLIFKTVFTLSALNNDENIKVSVIISIYLTKNKCQKSSCQTFIQPLKGHSPHSLIYSPFLKDDE